MPIPQQTLDQPAISSGGYETIVERLRREPNELELGLFGSPWSEHSASEDSLGGMEE